MIRILAVVVILSICSYWRWSYIDFCGFFGYMNQALTNSVQPSQVCISLLLPVIFGKPNPKAYGVIQKSSNQKTYENSVWTRKVPVGLLVGFPMNPNLSAWARSFRSKAPGITELRNLRGNSAVAGRQMTPAFIILGVAYSVFFFPMVHWGTGSKIREINGIS